MRLQGFRQAAQAARHFGWSLPASPSGLWYFNPFAWQFLFVLGAWIAVGGAQAVQSVIRTRTVFCIAIAYTIFAFVVTMATHAPALGKSSSALDFAAIRSQRQDESRALPSCASHCYRRCSHPVPAVEVSNSAMALARAAHQMRSEFSSGVLHRHRSFILCPRCNRDEPEFALGSNLRGRYRNIAHDRKRILFDVVQTADRALAAHLRPLLKLERSEPVANQNADSSKGVRHAIY
jgi:hypothetical protein